MVLRRKAQLDPGWVIIVLYKWGEVQFKSVDPTFIKCLLSARDYVGYWGCDMSIGP